MPQTRQKFATQVDGALLADLRGLARQEGRQIQALVEEAIAALIEQRRQGTVRPHVMNAYLKSHARYGSLYKKLAQ
ncbi:MAG: hypothetical protein OXK73_15160 [Rhodospirillaceae bacterium]|nr:hypothetical protein [Rhodospirillaceae bacterium]